MLAAVKRSQFFLYCLQITTCDIDVFGIQADGSEKICAKMLQTMMCIEARAERAPLSETNS